MLQTGGPLVWSILVLGFAASALFMEAMSMLGCGLLALAAAAAGGLLCRRIAARLPHPTLASLLSRARHLYLALPLLLVFPILSLYITANPSMHWDLPWVVQLHYSTIQWGGISGTLGYIFGFCCAAGFLTGQRGRWGLVGLALAALCAIQTCAQLRTRSERPALAEARVSRDGVVLQSCSATCVPAAGANIAALLGLHATERELVELFHTTREGTFPAQALMGLKHLGLRGRKVTVPGGDITHLQAPAMLFILGDTHAVAYVKSSNGVVELWDPSSGKRFLPQGRVRELWQGHAIEFSR